MTESSPPKLNYRWVILGVCWLAYIVAFMQRLSIGPLAPFLKEDLSLSASQVGTLMSAAAFGYMITLIPSGWLVDKVGPRWMLLVGELIGGIFLAAMFTVDTYVEGLVFMGLAGFGLGSLMPATTKAILVWFPLKERATAMGFKQTSVNIGGIITASTLPAVALALSWHYGFLGIGFIAVIIGIVSFILYKEPPPGITDTIFEPAKPSGSEPVFREILKGRDIWCISLTGLCFCAIEFAVLAHFVLYLQEVLLFAVVNAGLLLALLEAGGAFGKPVSGFISDRLFSGKRKPVYILLCVLTVIICFIWSLLGQGSPTWLLGILAVIIGLSAITWGGVHLTLVGEIAGKELAGKAIGASSTLLLVGSMMGPPVFGHIVDVTGIYTMAWQFLVVLGIIGLVSLIFVREGKRRI